MSWLEIAGPDRRKPAFAGSRPASRAIDGEPPLGIEYFVQQLVNGVTLGAVYGLIAIGYSMVYGIIGMINFAHGDIFMIGAFHALITFLLLGLFGVTWSAWHCASSNGRSRAPPNARRAMPDRSPPPRRRMPGCTEPVADARWS